MIRINKIKILIYNIAILHMLLLNSCGVYNETGNGQYLYNYQYEKYEPYLSIDSVYKTPEEKNKFDELKTQFLKVYLDSSNCHYKAGNRFGDYNIRNVYVDNILHTLNYDTLLVLVVTDEAMLDKYGQVILWENGKSRHERIRGTPMRVLVDDQGKWKFICKPISYGTDANPYTDEALRDVRRSLKRAIIRGSYFKKNLKPDPTFWHRLFTDPNIFFADPHKDGFPLN